jgi:hypothetical protein
VERILAALNLFDFLWLDTESAEAFDENNKLKPRGVPRGCFLSMQVMIHE